MFILNTSIAIVVLRHNYNRRHAVAKSREDFFQEDRKFIDTHIEESVEILNKINKKSISDMVEIISECQSSAGRFLIGVGGSAQLLSCS